MDGTGNAAQIAAYIVQKNWGMLRGIFAGMGDREVVLRAILAATQGVPDMRLAEFILAAVERKE